jgi:hypothetical protein
MEDSITTTEAVDASDNVPVESATLLDGNDVTAILQDTPTTEITTTVTLEFVDFVELQTKLVLLPLVEEEGRGAFVRKQDDDKDAQGMVLVGMEDDTEDDFRDLDFTCILARIRNQPPPIRLVLEETAKDDDDNEDNASHHHEEKKEDVHVASTRQPSLPSSPSKRQPINSALDDRLRQPSGNHPSISNSMFALSAWGLRVKAQSEKLAADAMATMKNNNMTTPQKPSLSLTLDGTSSPQEQERFCEMYLQTNLGAYFCVSGPRSALNDTNTSGSPKKSQLRVTTSSLLCIRQSATEALVVPGQEGRSPAFSFQWYRSRTTGHDTKYRALSSLASWNDSSLHSQSTNTAASVESSSSSSSLDEGGSRQWIPLEGATHATFQPNTTLVGRRLKCVIQKTVPLSPTSGSHEDSPKHVPSLLDHDDDDDDDNVVVCELQQPVRADMVMFNGARQAMVRGAKFGNMVRRGDTKHVYRIEVGMTRKTHVRTQRSVTVNAVHVYCLDENNDYVPLTDQPLWQVSARADATAARHVDLIVSCLPPSVQEHPDDDENAYTTRRFLKEHCVPDETRGTLKLELEAPNRLTRESFLLALGIANYHGKPALLDDTTVLYRDDENDDDKVSRNAKAADQSAGPPSPTGLTVPKMPQRQVSAVTPTKDDEDDNDDDDSLSTTTSGDASAAALPESPQHASAVDRSAVTQTSPSGFFSCQSSMPGSGNPSLAPVATTPCKSVETAQVGDLLREVEFLRSQLARKDKTITDLQRQVQRSDAAHQKTKQSLGSCEQELQQARQDCERIQISKRQVERSLQSQDDSAQRVEALHKERVAGLEAKIHERHGKIADLEKANRALQNELAVQKAAVGARETKLARMRELQEANQKLSEQMAEQKVIQKELMESRAQCENLTKEVDSIKSAESKLRTELEEANKQIASLEKLIQGEQTKASSHQSELDALIKKNQQLKGERNNYKQKNDSLTKEISRLCRNGRTIREIEKTLADHESLVQEAGVLRVQKRKAVEEAHQYRTWYENAKATEEVLGVEEDTRRAVERSAELERLLAEMTDYVHAKEMQLETMRQVNEALQEEIHNLAKANFRKNEV